MIKSMDDERDIGAEAPRLLADTAPWAERLQFDLFRQAPAWRKLEIADDLIRGAIGVSMAELQRRFPGARPAELKRHLADVVLGPDVAIRVYGPLRSPPSPGQ
jgi:hypothetical protein